VGSILDMKQYGVAEMGESERKEFTSWYDAEKHKVFDNRRVLDSTVRMMSPSCVRRVRYFVGILWMSET